MAFYTKWIYPPAAYHKAVFAIANPDDLIMPGSGGFLILKACRKRPTC